VPPAFAAMGIDNKPGLLQDRCGRRMLGLKVQIRREYFERITVRPIRQAELTALLNEITIRRRPASFAINLNSMCYAVSWIPSVLEVISKLPLRRLRIWSTSLSTGEEPYTLRVLLLDETNWLLKDWLVEILATNLRNAPSRVRKEAVYGIFSTRNLTAPTIRMQTRNRVPVCKPTHTPSVMLSPSLVGLTLRVPKALTSEPGHSFLSRTRGTTAQNPDKSFRGSSSIPRPPRLIRTLFGDPC